MSILHVQIVDFDLQIISYLLVLSDLNLELGKAVEISPQNHVISAENSSNPLLQVCVINISPSSSHWKQKVSYFLG
jgi:hypothetical protein